MEKPSRKSIRAPSNSRGKTTKMSSSPTPQASPTSHPEFISELEHLVIKVRYLNRSTRIFLHYLPYTRLYVPAPRLREKCANLQDQYKELESHYGWTLASDREQVARVEENMEARDDVLRHNSELNDFSRMFGEVETVKGILGAFSGLEGELEEAWIGFREGEEQGGL